MKRWIIRVAAVMLSAVMIFSMTGCVEALYIASELVDAYAEYESYYSDYDSYYSDYYDYYGDYYSDGYYDEDGSYYGDGSYDDYFGLIYDYFGTDEYYNDYYSGYSDYYDYYGMDSSSAGVSSGVLVVANNQNPTPLREQWTKLKGNGNDTVTIMIYMCAADLESQSGLATKDIQEMASATLNNKVRIIIECGGTTKWSLNGLTAGKNYRIIVESGSYTILETNKRTSMVSPENLTDFINFCTENFPADRNMLILWDHGAGAVDGWGYDEYYSATSGDTLTINELQDALYAAGTKFDFIGFDACLMSCMEVACVLYDYADYMIASEDYESGYGWEYQYWLSALSENTSIPTVELAKIICDDFVSESGSESAILACIDLSYMVAVFNAWREFAFAAEDQLLSAEFSWETENVSRKGNPSRYNIDDILSMLYSEAEINDMRAIASAVEGVEESDALAAALDGAIVYAAANSHDAHMTGLAVTLPYGDAAGYNNLEKIFTDVGFDDEYVEWLENFASAGGSFSEYDWYDYFSDWQGYNSYDYNDYYGDYYDYYGDSYGDYYDYYGGYDDYWGYDDDYGYGDDYGWGWGW